MWSAMRMLENNEVNKFWTVRPVNIFLFFLQVLVIWIVCVRVFLAGVNDLMLKRFESSFSIDNVESERDIGSQEYYTGR